MICFCIILLYIESSIISLDLILKRQSHIFMPQIQKTETQFIIILQQICFSPMFSCLRIVTFICFITQTRNPGSYPWGIPHIQSLTNPFSFYCFRICLINTPHPTHTHTHCFCSKVFIAHLYHWSNPLIYLLSPRFTI